MAEEPTLPPLPPALPASDRRKRGRSPQPPPTHSSTSSDPAFFSSDDDPALDNYQSRGRRKKRYVGTWFDQQPASSDSGVGEDTRPSYPVLRRKRGAPQPQKREFRRQLDSGVWMGTDGSLTDTDDSLDLAPVPARLPLAPPRAQAPVPPSPARPSSSPGEEEARIMIRSCVDNGIEQVDLSGLGLERIPKGFLEPISHIVPIPNVAKDVAFEQRDPYIRVFLSNNRLRSFPVELFNIEHLTVLSLRGNRLVTIPPAISKLGNLEALNIAQNFLRFLPGELLDLLQPGSKLRNFNFEPNWFCRPDATDPNNAGAEEYERLTFGARRGIEPGLESGWLGVTSTLQCRTPVHFMDSALKDYSRFILGRPETDLPGDSALEVELFSELAVPKELAPELRSHSATSKLANPRGVKSLFELALRACATSQQADRIPEWLREDEGWPAHFAPAAKRATEIHGEGGVKCSVCGRKTLMPLTQWIEFRHVGQTSVTADAEGNNETRRLWPLGDMDPGGLGAKPVPFLRVGCSWKCVPARVEAVKAQSKAEAGAEPEA